MNRENKINRSDYIQIAQNDIEQPLLAEESFCFTEENKQEVIQQNKTQDQQEQNMAVIHCGNQNCKVLLKYPQQAYIVICPKCNSKTATQPLSKLRCGRCSIVLLYPASKNLVICQCGALNQVPTQIVQ